ncbi:MAG TPA: uracil-DNA glycosylase, partial [Candidatus Ozemobacteraceae bacterium]|nr:uracil-DNA glycosylase [Candidatus Ozemobacteraceae bacterium]
MARKKKDSGPAAPPSSVDLLEILTPPGRECPHDFELAPPPNKRTWAETFFAWSRADAAAGVAVAPGAQDANENRAHYNTNTNTGLNIPADGAGSGDASFEASDAADSFETICSDIAACQSCSLWQTRTNTVPGEGNPRAKLILIGEAPGADEDATGRPFVGRAGQHLDKILAAAGFKREEVFIGNILKCRPPDNRTPTLEEMKCCTVFLRRQLALIKPRLIGLLGNTSCKYVLGPDVAGITKIRGKWFDSIFDIPCMPMYHPSYLLRNQSRAVGSPNWEMWQDIQALKRRYDEL